ncbi:MFS monocarboxylate transporter [Rasamsonia emersonii CBS 393.64]|uniref:MFS monocarboxylate transporter n=1 Tax=Rasamsonia emersonii (strain ATCC 16479 / CBS 393.64 / IMI 116815) TaxID=1408163 RepID=A0A0F4YRZ1_RASE3|nr:MFS monocarboxylate transporter [Rasamsonia emersonii CBS 393.64]KKA20383.1 MFS monocarboxylate transporter [Rasamsonia emersonii CBS 393.64]
MEFEHRHSNSSSIHTAHHDGSHMTASGQRHLDDAVEEYNHNHDYTRNHNDNANTNTNNQQPQLPPRDGGRDAWLFLAACFMIEALASHSPSAFSKITTARTSRSSSRATLLPVGPARWKSSTFYPPSSLAYCWPSPTEAVRHPLGFLIMCVAIALSSFATNTTHLLLMQGIGYGVGASLTYAPTILFMEEWFVNKRGLAFGIMWAGTGVSGVVLPVFLQWLLNAHGFRTTLRVWSVVLFILTAPLLYFVKPRLPIAQSASMRPFDFSFLWNRTFLIFQLGNVLEALGFFLPSIYLPTYASHTLGASNLVASLTVILVNLASVFGCIIMGMLVDRCHVTTCIFISTVGSTVAIFLLWGFSLTLAPLFIFCIAYGIFAGPFSATWPAIMKEVQKNANSAEPTIVFAFLAAGRGIGNVVSGPLSEKLLQGFPWRDAAGGAYGSGYGTLIVFTGITAFLGGLSVLARPLRLL